jgi:hypothetical protein
MFMPDEPHPGPDTVSEFVPAPEPPDVVTSSAVPATPVFTVLEITSGVCAMPAKMKATWELDWLA